MNGKTFLFLDFFLLPIFSNLLWLSFLTPAVSTKLLFAIYMLGLETFRSDPNIHSLKPPVSLELGWNQDNFFKSISDCFWEQQENKQFFQWSKTTANISILSFPYFCLAEVGHLAQWIEWKIIEQFWKKIAIGIWQTFYWTALKRQAQVRLFCFSSSSECAREVPLILGEWKTLPHLEKKLGEWENHPGLSMHSSSENLRTHPIDWFVCYRLLCH